MPAIASDLSAVIGFNLPDDRLGHDPSVYLTYDKDLTKPVEHIRVPVADLRPELESEELEPPQEQLYTRGYAVEKHQSRWVDDIGSEEGVDNYLQESAEWVSTSSSLELTTS